MGNVKEQVSPRQAVPQRSSTPPKRINVLRLSILPPENASFDPFMKQGLDGFLLPFQ